MRHTALPLRSKGDTLKHRKYQRGYLTVGIHGWILLEMDGQQERRTYMAKNFDPTNLKEGSKLSTSPFPFKNEGDTLIGVISGKKERDIQGRSFGQYLITDSNGEEWRVYGNVVLDDALDKLKVGGIVRIVFDGMIETPNGFTSKAYTVTEMSET